ncbi:ABC transporter permease [Marihabitans asiaticum]|uniref:Osmoprotectant transport system permease protein n=1 Tax=Marihabitans asiaticum TaxID=415218 RepID=A0A560WE14_9MICO|nr:ABC transporter permease subunit [Marihabitans asiaticum]TWD15868.1 osmoprotectant transport system permease protein [Marihabitans asiaticum]
MDWILAHLDDIGRLTARHVVLAGVPLVLGLVISLGLGWVAHRVRGLRGIALTGSGLLYTIPSLALFVLMPLVLGTSILSPINVIVAMTLYTVALLVRTVVDGLDSVPPAARQAATAIGYGPARRFVGVELPLAVPVIAAGLRVASVSNVSIVSVASLVGVSQLGDLLVDGFNRAIGGELLAGTLGCIVLALVFDALIRLGERLLTPWLHTGREASA